MATIGEMLNIAVAAHQAGRFPEAETIYRQIVAQLPQHSDAWHLLGVLAYQVGKPAEAVDLIGRAIALVDGIGVYYANLAEAYRALNQLDKAEAMFRRAIELDPNQVEGRNNLALLLQATGRASESLSLLDTALALRPDYPEGHNNRGLALEYLRRLPEAVEAYTTAARLRPSYAAPLENLGRVGFHFYHQGEHDQAAQIFERIVSVDPRSSASWSNLGAIRFQQRRYVEAEQMCRRAIELNPGHADAWSNLGSAQLRQTKYPEAEQSFRKALEFQPHFPDALNNLGLLLNTLGRADEAKRMFEQSLEQRPDFVGAMQSLGLIEFRAGDYRRARQWYDRALQIEPNNAETLNKIGTCVMAQGDPPAAIEYFARAMQIKPEFVTAQSNFLFCHLYLPDATLPQLVELHREFERRHGQTTNGQRLPPINRPDAERRLRVGFVSADLRHHPIGFLLVDTFKHLDPAQLELVCYATRRGHDAVSDELRKYASLWRDAELVADDDLADMIRRDAIDVLFDLSGHTSGGRLPVFARRPAPVQVTWMGYPATTGLSTMDYLMSDRWMTPVGVEPHYVERIYRMPEAIASYRLPTELPPLVPPPSTTQGYVTFGSFNNSSKINPRVIELWSRVLHAVPRSRMFLKFRALTEPAVQERLLGWFAAQGIERSRIEFAGFGPFQEMLAAYGKVDVALDTFPYTGGTTTILALLMGVPVLTLPGETMASRQSLSVLSQAGCEQFVATSADDFVTRAVALVNDPRRLAELRPWTRQQMQAAPFCDARRFAGQFTNAVREMWREWVQKTK